MYEHTCPTCAGKHPVAEASLPPEFMKQLSPETTKLIQAAFDKKEYSGILSIVGKLLTNQVHENYSQIKVDWNKPDVEMLHRLTSDVWSFSAAKNWQQMRDLTLALKDENGKLREFDAFKEAAQAICSKYNENWLQTEYNMAVASSQNAARWVQFKADENVIPFLKYQTVGDAHVRVTHAALDGITRKVSDSFWSTHYPPNGWNCRCEVIQSPGTKTGTATIPDVPIPEIFRTNLAQTGLIFPKNHPYYTDIPRAEIRKSIAYLPPENTFVTYNIGSKAQIDIHPLHGEKEIKQNVDACKVLKKLDANAKIQLMPIINENDIVARKKFYPQSYLDKFPSKNADMLYNGEVIEIEIPSGSKSSIQNAIKNGKSQASHVMIQLPEGMNVKDASKIVNGQMRHYEGNQDLKVTIFDSNEKRTFETKKESKKESTFKPASNIDEAIKKAKEYGFKTVRFGNTELRHINKVLEAIEDEFNTSGKINIDILRLYTDTNSRGGGIVGGHFTAGGLTQDNELAFNTHLFSKNLYKPVLSFDEQKDRINAKIASSERTISMFESKIQPGIKKSYMDMIKKEIKKERSSITTYNIALNDIEKSIKKGLKPIPNNIAELLPNQDDQIKSTVFHELGHYVDHTSGRPKFSEDIPPSVYGNTERGEYFAEYYAKYKMLGEKDIPSDILKIFKSWKKK